MAEKAQSLQDTFLNHVRKNKTPLTIFLMNGVKLLEYEIGSPDWEARVKASKFGKMPGYGRTMRGYIALQDHGNVVAFRNIKIKTL